MYLTMESNLCAAQGWGRGTEVLLSFADKSLSILLQVYIVQYQIILV